MAVQRDEVDVAVQVHVGEHQAERQWQERSPGEPRPAGQVLEQPIAADLREQGKRLAREIADHDRQTTLSGDVPHVHPHPRPSPAELVVRHTRRQGDVGKRAVAVVEIQKVLVGIVGDEDVGPPVVVEVRDGYAERFALRIEDAGPLGDVGEPAVPQVSVQATRFTLILLGCCVRLVGSVQCDEQVGLRGPLDVIAHEKIQPPVAIDVDPARRRRPRRRISPTAAVAVYSGAGRNVGKAAAVVAQQLVVAQGRQIDVDVSVCVIICERSTHAVYGEF